MDPSPTLQSKSELVRQSSALASQIVTLRSNFAVWQDTITSLKSVRHGSRNALETQMARKRGGRSSRCASSASRA